MGALSKRARSWRASVCCARAQPARHPAHAARTLVGRPRAARYLVAPRGAHRLGVPCGRARAGGGGARGPERARLQARALELRVRPRALPIRAAPALVLVRLQEGLLLPARAVRVGSRGAGGGCKPCLPPSRLACGAAGRRRGPASRSAAAGPHRMRDSWLRTRLTSLAYGDLSSPGAPARSELAARRLRRGPAPARGRPAAAPAAGAGAPGPAPAGSAAGAPRLPPPRPRLVSSAPPRTACQRPARRAGSDAALGPAGGLSCARHGMLRLGGVLPRAGEALRAAGRAVRWRRAGSRGRGRTRRDGVLQVGQPVERRIVHAPFCAPRARRRPRPALLRRARGQRGSARRRRRRRRPRRGRHDLRRPRPLRPGGPLPGRRRGRCGGRRCSLAGRRGRNWLRILPRPAAPVHARRRAGGGARAFLAQRRRAGLRHGGRAGGAARRRGRRGRRGRGRQVERAQHRGDRAEAAPGGAVAEVHIRGACARAAARHTRSGFG